ARARGAGPAGGRTVPGVLPLAGRTVPGVLPLATGLAATGLAATKLARGRVGASRISAGRVGTCRVAPHLTRTDQAVIGACLVGVRVGPGVAGEGVGSGPGVGGRTSGGLLLVVARHRDPPCRDGSIERRRPARPLRCRWELSGNLSPPAHRALRSPARGPAPLPARAPAGGRAARAARSVPVPARTPPGQGPPASPPARTGHRILLRALRRPGAAGWRSTVRRSPGAPAGRAPGWRRW